jgi:hypothetical protein
MIARDKDGNPITCDCPDGPSHPCDGKGWCSNLKGNGPYKDYLKDCND